MFHAKIPVDNVLLVHSVFSPRISLGGSCARRPNFEERRHQIPWCRVHRISHFCILFRLILNNNYNNFCKFYIQCDNWEGPCLSNARQNGIPRRKKEKNPGRGPVFARDLHLCQLPQGHAVHMGVSKVRWRCCVLSGLHSRRDAPCCRCLNVLVVNRNRVPSQNDSSRRT